MQVWCSHSGAKLLVFSMLNYLHVCDQCCDTSNIKNTHLSRETFITCFLGDSTKQDKIIINLTG